MSTPSDTPDEPKLYTIPFMVSATHFSLMIVLLQEGIDRIRAYDPAEVPLKEIPPMPGTLKDIIITYATPEEMQTVIQLTKAGKGFDALRLLTRGYRFRPERGDGGPMEVIV